MTEGISVGSTQNQGMKNIGGHFPYTRSINLYRLSVGFQVWLVNLTPLILTKTPYRELSVLIHKVVGELLSISATA
jgi:hypothetical protein